MGAGTEAGEDWMAWTCCTPGVTVVTSVARKEFGQWWLVLAGPEGDEVSVLEDASW
jgi:hypothetical protein